MSHHLRLWGKLLVVFVMMLALLPAVTATATEGTMQIATDTTLTEDHTGQIQIIADNITLDCAGYKVVGPAAPSELNIGIQVHFRSGVTVRNCDVSGFIIGIALHDTQDSTIEDNTLHDNVSGDVPVGIALNGASDNVVRNNVATGNGGDGIAAQISAGPSERNIFEGNTVNDNGRCGMILSGTASNTLRDNVAKRNTTNGIQLLSSTETTITGNTLEDNGLHGLAAYQSQQLTVTGNTTSNNGVGGDEGDGMKIRETGESVFTGNMASGNFTSGFRTDGTGNTFTDNDSHRNGEFGFADAAAVGASTYSDNRCIDNVSGGSDPSGLCDESGHFADDDGNTFELDIEWMAREGITLGCNPPTNDLYCPDGSVTRGQMAAFLVRALELPAASSAGFVDTVGSTFEKDIDRLAAAGITRGCNPPANDRFCPDDSVRREVMAAFLVRALGYTDDGGGDLFVDDDGSIFESDIDKLATAGVTRGCNPPLNDRFCPTSNVTRGQMAAFLHRALG